MSARNDFNRENANRNIIERVILAR